VAIFWLILVICPPALVLAGLILARVTLLAVTVERASMSPTLEDGDRVLVWRYWPTRWLRKGQIIIFWPWLPASKSKRLLGTPDFVPYIKRVLALPGDTLVTSLSDLAESCRSEQTAAHDSAGRRTWHIPPGHIFVKGDNPLGGVDSLTWGPVPSNSVLGVVVMRLPSKARSVHASPSHAATEAAAAGRLPEGRDAPNFTAETLV
jgi:signal peptidase I